MPPKCAIRNTPNAEICSLCHSRAYCSVEWQQTDWPLHKLLCKAKNDLPAGPNPSYKLGILFPDLSTRKHHNLSGSNVNAVKLTWLHTEAKKFDESPNPSKLLGESAFKKCLAIWKNVLRDYDLEHTVTVWYRDTFLVDGSSTNATVVVSTRGRVVFEWEKLLTTSTC